MSTFWIALVGYLSAVLVGGVLGTLGAGGAILAVPTLVYFFRVPVGQATHLSLGIVSVISFVSMVSSLKRREIDFQWAFRFFIPSSLGVLISRVLIVPRVPKSWDFILLLWFAVLMLFAARAMLRPSPRGASIPSAQQFVLRSFLVGMVTGLLGAGGGFLIVPVLILWAGIPFQVAVGTSLVVIFLNSTLGFLIGWNASVLEFAHVVLFFIGMAMMGLVISRTFFSQISTNRLRLLFAILLSVVAGLTFIKEFIRVFT